MEGTDSNEAFSSPSRQMVNGLKATLTGGSWSSASTVVMTVPLSAFGATRPRYKAWVKTGEKSFMSWNKMNKMLLKWDENS